MTRIPNDPGTVDGGHDRIPPANLDAEAALLGSLMVERALFERVEARLQPAAFYHPIHRSIYEAMLALGARLDDAGAPVPFDKVAIAEELQRRGEYDRVGGMAYLSGLMNAVPTASSVDHYARIVREKAARRVLIDLHRRGMESAFRPDGDFSLLVGEHRAALERIEERYAAGTLRPMSMAEASVRYDAALADRPTFVLDTPWPTVNRSIGGFHPALHVWSAAGGMGKTHALLQLALWHAERHGDVAVFALEIGATDTYAEMALMLAGIDVDELHGGLNDFQQEALNAARARAEKLPIHIFDDQPRLTSREVSVEILRLSERLAAQGGRLACAIVDVVGELADVVGFHDAAARSRRETTKHERQTLALKLLRDTSRRARVPVHAVMHQNRDTGAKRPSQHTIRDGGDAESTAANIILLWREDPKKDRERGLMILDKTRGGRERDIPMAYRRGVWLDQGSKPKQDRPWFIPADPEQQQLGGTVVPLRPRSIATEVDGQPARVVTYANGEPPITQAEVDRIAFPDACADDVSDADLDNVRHLFGGPS